MTTEGRTVKACWVTALSLLLVAWGGSSPGDEVKTIRFMYQLSLFGAPQFVAMKKGWYDEALKKVGYRVEYASTLGGNPILEAMAAGKVDYGELGTSVAVTGIGRGVPLKIVMTTNIGGESIVVPASSKVSSMSDLKGQKIGIQGKGTMQDFILRKALADNSILLSQVQIVEIPAPQLPGALERGQVDAATLWEPVASNLVLSGKGRVLAYGQDIWPNHDNQSPSATLRAIKEDPQAVRALVQQTVRGLNYCAEHADDCKQILAEKLNLPLNVIDYAWSHTLRPKDGRPNGPSVEEFAKHLYDWGMIKRKPSLNDLVDTQFLN